jgi:hypothetical protein
MSNAGQIILDIVGAVAGYFIGGPTGALYGLALASGAGQFLFPTQLPPVTGPRITDHNTTTSALGDPVIIGYGTFMSSGTVHFLADLIEHATTTQQGGKGGPTQTSTTFSYTQSIGIGLCETTSMNGVNTPIIGIQRAWENGELVYDTRPQQPGESASDYNKRAAYTAKYASTFVLYLGTEDQEPDPTIELQQGANTPFYRGLAYIVYPDRALRTDQGLRHPTFKFEILKAATVAPEVIFPTFLPGANNANLQTNMIAADTTYGRYYIWNATTGHFAVLGFNMFDNTQFVENDTLTGFAPLGGVGLAVAPDGFVLVTWFDSVSTALIARLDPLTLSIDGGPKGYNARGVDWTSYATATVNFGMGSVYILAAVGVLQEITLIDTGSLGQIVAYTIYPHPIITSAPNESGCAVFWVISNTPSTGPTGGNVAIVKIEICDTLTTALWLPDTDYAIGNRVFNGSNKYVCKHAGTSASSGGPMGTGSDIHDGSVIWKYIVVGGDTLTHTFAPSEFDPLWTWVSTIGDLLVDLNDGHVMFRVAGGGSGATNTAYVLKCDGNTGAIDWISPVIGAANYNFGTSQNQIANNIWWLADNPPGLSGYYRIDVVTGAVTIVSLSSLTGGGSQVGAQVTSSGGGGAILAPLVGGPAGSSPGWSLILPEASLPGQVRIADIVADLCDRSGLTSHDTSSLGDESVDGYMIASTPMMARDAIVPLRSVGFFDSCETGDTMRFVRRGGVPAMTLLTTDIGAYETATTEDPAPANAVSNTMESDLPQQIRLTYTSPSRDYQPGQQLSLPRFDTMSDQLTDVQLGGICIDDDQAAQAAEILWNDAWASDHTYTFAVDQSKAALEPTDVVLVPMVDTLMRVRILAIDDASQIMRTMTAVSDDDGNYVSRAIAAPVPYRVTMRFYAGSSLILIDAPLLLDSNDTGRTSAPLYSVVYPTNTDTWTGAAILESDDAGATFTNVATATGAAATGQATTALGDVANPFLTDTTNSVTVKMAAGATLPASVTTAQLLNGANGAALINADGSVEIFQFRDVAVVSADTVTLSYLLRGRRGSDEMTGGHAVGNRFVMLNLPGTVQKTNIAISDLNTALQWKAVGSRDTIASATVVPFTTVGRSLMPRAPWNTRTILSGSDILINADRRSRIENDSPISFASPTLALNEDSEAYQVDVYDAPGTSVLRTLSGASLPITYPAADVAADFGGTPANLWLAVYQMSGEVGRGFTHKVKTGVPT